MDAEGEGKLQTVRPTPVSFIHRFCPLFEKMGILFIICKIL